jgi:protein TonB
MVPGLNTNVERNDVVFHVQTEDFGRTKPIVQTLIYLAGEVVTVLEASYADLAKSDAFDESEVRRRLTAQHYRLVAEIEAGAYDIVAEPPETVVTDEELTQKVLDYLDSAIPFDGGVSPPQEISAGLNRIVEDHARAAQADPVAPEAGPAASAGPSTTVPESRAEEAAPQHASVVHAVEAAMGLEREAENRDAPRVVEVLQEIEGRQPVEVRQVVVVRRVGDAASEPRTGCELSGALKGLDAHLDEQLPRARPRRSSGIWMAAAVAVTMLVLGVVAGRKFSSTVGTEAPGEVTVATPREATVEAIAQPEPEAKPEPIEATAPAPVVQEAQPAPKLEPEPVEAIAPAPVVQVRQQEPPPAPGPEPAAIVEEPIAVASAQAEAQPEASETAAATLAPPVPRPVPREPDPVEAFDAPEEAPVPPPAPQPESVAPEPKVRAGDLVDIASVDIVPKPMQRGIPEYPKRAKRKRQQGRVPLELLIDEKGQVTQVKLVDGVDASDLTQAALDAARSWRYTPALKGNQRVRVWKPVTVNFTLDSGNTTRVRVEE